MSTPKNATNTPSPYCTEMVQWADENIPHVPGFYILHFDDKIGDVTNPVGHASHYCGFANDLHARFVQHLGGCGKGGSRLCEIANEKRIKFHMAQAYQTVSGDLAYAYEQYFKSAVKNSKRHCPECGQHPLPVPRNSTLDKYKDKVVA